MPKPQPIQLTQCGAPADYYHSDEDDDYSEINSHPQNDDSIESEILNEDDKIQIFLYKMHPAKDWEAAVAKFNDLPLYRQLGLTEDPSSLNKHILYKSKEEIRAAVFIQAMFRVRPAFIDFRCIWDFGKQRDRQNAELSFSQQLKNPISKASSKSRKCSKDICSGKNIRKSTNMKNKWKRIIWVWGKINFI